LHWIKPVIAIFSLGLLSCELGEVDLNNPLDTQANAEKGINPPALVFSPSSVNTSVGGNAIFRVYAQEVTGVAGIHAKIQYDNTKLNVSTVSPGTFFNSTQAPIFIYEDNVGVLDIFTFYMGSDKTKDGTGDVALITFRPTLAGQSQVQFTAESELLDPQDVPIEIKGLGTGVVNAQ
tara:strand:- start:26 stop:556 length:531 start_codon:yes stop_codon:yes gene_type:complete